MKIPNTPICNSKFSHIVKVCGMTDPANIEAVAALQPAMMGFIFWRGSLRFAGNLNREVILSLPSSIQRVGVFVNENHDNILHITARYGIATVQLHGDESPEDCHRLRDEGMSVIKAVGVDAAADFENLEAYTGCVDMLLLDKKSSSRGGTGKAYDHSILNDYTTAIPYLMSGGVSPGDVSEIAHSHYPHMEGVDINSRFESKPGMKDVSLVKKFIAELYKQS